MQKNESETATIKEILLRRAGDFAEHGAALYKIAHEESLKMPKDEKAIYFYGIVSTVYAIELSKVMRMIQPEHFEEAMNSIKNMIKTMIESMEEDDV